jgi:hypothetical protein
MKLSTTQMEFLIDHVERDTVRPYGNSKNEDATRHAMVDMKLIRETNEGTVTTAWGREAKCVVLAWMADCLIRAQYNFDNGRCDPSRMTTVGTDAKRIQPERGI